MRKKNAYLISKPVQYFNAKNIKTNDLLKDCFLVNNFNKAKEFYLFVKEKSVFWQRVFFFKNDLLAYLYIILHQKKYKKLFIYSDNSILIGILVKFLKSIDIYVYEEGLGSYTYHPEKKKLLYKNIRKKLGLTNWLGGSKYTKAVYVYEPAILQRIIPESKEKNIIALDSSFYNSIKEAEEIEFFFQDLDLSLFREKKIVLLISSWTLNDKYKSIINNSYPNHTIILKPHPHTKRLNLQDEFSNIISNPPAEILLAKLVDIAKETVVIHEGSSTIIYLPKRVREEIIEVDLSDTKNEEYNFLRSIFAE